MFCYALGSLPIAVASMQDVCSILLPEATSCERRDWAVDLEARASAG